MTTSPNQRLKLLYLMKILLDKTDESHSLSINDLIAELNKYGIKAERKAIYSDIELLKLFGLDIKTKQSKTFTYHVVSREFEVAELRLLVDAVQSSHFLTTKKSDALIDKLCGLVSTHQAAELRKFNFTDNQLKVTNEYILYAVDAIHKAILEGKKVSFHYKKYTIDKTKQLNRDGERYIVSPFAMTWSHGNYYLIGHFDKHNGITHFRVDRVSDIEVLQESRCEQAKNFNFANYHRSVFDMYGGEIIPITLEFDNTLIDTALDRFGEDIEIVKVSDDKFIVEVDIAVSPTFFAWVFQFIGKVKITAPEQVLCDYKKMMEHSK